MIASPAKILIVDDATSFAECAAEILNGRGYQTTTAEDAETCLLMMKENRPDLIIMDSNLPGIRGEKAVHTIRSKRKKIPIIGISAEDRAVAMRDAGVNVFLSKPFEFPELLETIAELLPSPQLSA